ncbi:hypothetical protein [Cellulosimicrobium sp. CUA-896]|uniref:hypothetical protein n=1 Tax=Cellulosimicrobium sp. CUA-896 TaxID=1517881 RepID=UPI001301339A|nr:hypothetical protein [Cellulosimicrobium sp. CUA-896]
MGVLSTGGTGAALLLDLAVRAVGPVRVVALVALGPGATAARRCAVAQAAHAAGVVAFDLCGTGTGTDADDDAGAVPRALELAVVVAPDDLDGGVGIPGSAPATCTPFVDARLDRRAVERLARELCTPVPVPPGPAAHDPVLPPRPGEAAHQHVATVDEVVQVEAAESELRRLGLELLVRSHGDLARLEAPRSELASVAVEPLRGEVLRAVRSAGFRDVALDLGRVTEPSGA